MAELHLTNFRKYGVSLVKDGSGEDVSRPGLSVRMNPGLNLIVGENDSGKTAIIDALKLLLSTQSNDFIKLEYEDFHFPDGGRNEEDRTSTLQIECVFHGFKLEEAKNFLEWLSIEKKDGVESYFLRVYLKGYRKGRKVYYDIKAGVDDEGSLLTNEARALLKATYLRPLRDAESELTPRKNSRLSHILDNHQAFENKESHQLKIAMEKANEMIINYFKGLDGDNATLTDDSGNGVVKKSAV